MADQKLTQLNESTDLTKDDNFYFVNDPLGVPASKRISWESIQNNLPTFAPQLRLTLETGIPVSTTDQTAKATIYYTPYIGSWLSLCSSDNEWSNYETTELAISLTSDNAVDKNYDIFCYATTDNVPALEKLVWTSDNTRATDITRSTGGLYTKNGDATRLYIGTIRTSAEGQTSDSITNRLVWNMYNPVRRYLYNAETTSHSYNGAARKWNNSDANNLLKFVVGTSENTFRANLITKILAPDASESTVYIYLNGASVLGGSVSNFNAQYIRVGCSVEGVPLAGYNYLQAYELGNNAGSTFNLMAMYGMVEG